jgi:membrane fusion protein, heavy metal efflux system
MPSNLLPSVLMPSAHPFSTLNLSAPDLASAFPRRLQLWSVAFLCSSLLALSACQKAPEPVKAGVPGAVVDETSIRFPKDSPQLTTLRTVEVGRERDSFVRINGRISWDDSRTSRVTSPVAGKVTELRVMPGAVVKKGDLLALLSSPEFGQIQADSRKSETDVTLAERAYNRAKELHQAGLIAQKELQSLEADLSRARTERLRTQAREKAYGGGKLVDQMFRLVAPVPGTIVDRKITLGQEIRPDQNSDQPLFTISDPSRLWVSLDIPEVLSREIEVGEQVRISVPALPGEVFDATVEYVADFIDPQSRTIKARASVTNATRRLKAEMFVTADVTIAPSKALLVPATALYLQGERYYGFVEESPGTFVRHEFRAEEASLGYMRITSGGKQGEKIVADGALLLQQMLNAKSTAPKALPETASVNGAKK